MAVAITVAVVTALTAAPATAANQPNSPNRPATTESARHSGAAAFAKHNVPNPLLKEVFAEQQDGDGSDAPTLSALCQTYLGHPTPYHAISPNVDVINGDTVVPSGSQQGCDTAQNETTIAVNPANPRNIVSGTNDYRVFNTREARNDA
ncbi:MAG TPA: exo-alpha-sialidase, partial [Pseudonocardiaceae bacterium]